MSANMRPQTAREMGIMQGFPIPADKLATLDNWQEGPANRWAYQRVSQMLPTAVISRGPGAPSTFERRPVDLSGVTFEGQENAAMTVHEMLETTYTDGFLVLHDGVVVAERYFNGMTDGTLHLFQSVSKSLTGVLAGILVHDGRLAPDALMSEYVSEVRDSAFGGATVQQALDMQVSVVYSEDYDDPASEMHAQDRACAWRPLQPGDIDGIYPFLMTLDKASQHGHAFQYCSATTDALGWVLQRASGMTYAELMSREIWQPLGAEHDAAITVDRFGNPVPSGGICTTLRDLARFGQMVLQDGFANGRQIAPAAWIDDTRHNGDTEAFARNPDFDPSYPAASYRNQWWITGNEQGVFYGSGIYGQHLWIDPTARVVIAKLSSRPQAMDTVLGVLTLRGFAAIARHLSRKD